MTFVRQRSARLVCEDKASIAKPGWLGRPGGRSRKLTEDLSQTLGAGLVELPTRVRPPAEDVKLDEHRSIN